MAISHINLIYNNLGYQLFHNLTLQHVTIQLSEDILGAQPHLGISVQSEGPVGSCGLSRKMKLWLSLVLVFILAEQLHTREFVFLFNAVFLSKL